MKMVNEHLIYNLGMQLSGQHTVWYTIGTQCIFFLNQNDFDKCFYFIIYKEISLSILYS